MSNNEDIKTVVRFIESGEAALLLGPDISLGSLNVNGNRRIGWEDVLHEYTKAKGLDKIDISDKSELIDYITQDPASKHKFQDFLKLEFGIRTPAEHLRIINRFVWRRIYTFDMSDALDVVYRQNRCAGQRLTIIEPNTPVSKLRTSSEILEHVKLFGDALNASGDCYYTRPDFNSRYVLSSPWYRSLELDISGNPIIVMAEQRDSNYLFNFFRSLCRHNLDGNVVFVSNGLKPHQVDILKKQNAIIIEYSASEFLYLMGRSKGTTIDEITENETGLSIQNDKLRDSIRESFSVLTSKELKRLSETNEKEGTIYRFYRGDHVKWSDVYHGIHANLSSYSSWQRKIELSLQNDETGVPGNSMFLLTSLAGMGKTVGLMATAHWLRQRTDKPIL